MNGPFVDEDLCVGQQGRLTIDIFDNNDGNLSFYYNDILIPSSENFFDTFNVSIGLALVSPGIISNLSSSILFKASLTDLIIELPIEEYSPVNGTTRPILILLSAKILFEVKKKVKIINKINLKKVFIFMLLI